MFYMPGRSRGLWMIGPQIGKFSGGLANRGDEVCPENLRRSWKFANGRGWVVDSKVNITCINSESGNSINPLNLSVIENWYCSRNFLIHLFNF